MQPDDTTAGDDAMAADLVADPADAATIDSVWDEIQAAGGIEAWKKLQDEKGQQ